MCLKQWRGCKVTAFKLRLEVDSTVCIKIGMSHVVHLNKFSKEPNTLETPKFF